MIGLGPYNAVYVYPVPCDLRKGHAGLSAVVRMTMGSEVDTGDWYVFMNRTRKAVKILTVHHGGLLLLHKKMKKGTFPNIFKDASATALVLTAGQVQILLEG